MVRTRDFVLLLLTIGFLLIAIVGTEVWHSWRTTPLLSGWWGDTTTEVEYVGEVPVVPDTRTSRLEVLRAKVAERLSRDDEEVEASPVVAVASSTPSAPVATSSPDIVAIKTCSAYASVNVPWVPQTIMQENREGVRVYFERGLPDPLSSSTPDVIRALIPLRTWPAALGTCIPSDVIGIAMDGSLMRNNELSLYTVFGSDTLVGYALDGFPIYGSSGVATDMCGGATVGGSYRYVLAPERPGLITCFAATPARLQ
ncbi:MAG: YHYH protein [Candidatus Pacebacteria bacterium]|jgi:hypothetical protein|nr:YHYH protein [Candidatus Paceibacterota bacterium]